MRSFTIEFLHTMKQEDVNPVTKVIAMGKAYNDDNKMTVWTMYGYIGEEPEDTLQWHINAHESISEESRRLIIKVINIQVFRG